MGPRGGHTWTDFLINIANCGHKEGTIGLPDGLQQNFPPNFNSAEIGLGDDSRWSMIADDRVIFIFSRKRSLNRGRANKDGLSSLNGKPIASVRKFKTISFNF